MVNKNEKTTKNVAMAANEVKNAPATEEVKNQAKEEPAKEEPAKVEETKNEEPAKVTAKVAIKSISKIAAYVRTERKGVNATIRILMEAANDGNEDAINTLCALCDVPTDMAHAITLNNVRQAVNDYYPYVVVDCDRKINVKIKSVYYTTAQDTQGKEIEQAVHMINNGYYAIQANDYLQILTSAAKARAKGIKQKQLDSEAVYKSKDLAEVDKNVTVTELAAVANNREYKHDGVTVWRKHSLFGYYI